MARFSRINPATVSYTTQVYRELCPSCAGETSRSNLRVNALTGYAHAICDNCSQPLPPKRRKR